MIIYKTLQQKRSFKKFFGDFGSDKSEFFEDLLNNQEVDDILREAIVELEATIHGTTEFNRDEYRDLFDYVVNRESVEFMCKRYGIKSPDDIDIADVRHILSKIK